MDEADKTKAEISFTQEEFSSQCIVIKYGGHALIDENSRASILKNICELKRQGFLPILVHGGGPYIKKRLEQMGVESRFVAGHRYTDENMMSAVEIALRGEVNPMLVGELNRMGLSAIGLTGKDGRWVKAKKRVYFCDEGFEHDLGQVGDVAEVNTTLIFQLLSMGFTPVIATISADENGVDYNINADSFAGELAGAMKAALYINLTDVDGLYKDINNPESLISSINTQDIDQMYGGVISGGMIPKVESCTHALKKGAKKAFITSGVRGNSLLEKIQGSCLRRTLVEV